MFFAIVHQKVSVHCVNTSLRLCTCTYLVVSSGMFQFRKSLLGYTELAGVVCWQMVYLVLANGTLNCAVSISKWGTLYQALSTSKYRVMVLITKWGALY